MFDVQTTVTFDQWLSDLTDRAARTRIASRIDRLSWGNAGDIKAVGEGVIVILCGGDKSSQDKDIKKAKRIAAVL